MNCKNRLRKLDDCYDLVTHVSYIDKLEHVFKKPAGTWIDMYSIPDFLDASHTSMKERFYVTWLEMPISTNNYKMVLFYDVRRGVSGSAYYNMETFKDFNIVSPICFEHH